MILEEAAHVDYPRLNEEQLKNIQPHLKQIQLIGDQAFIQSVKNDGGLLFQLGSYFQTQKQFMKSFDFYKLSLDAQERSLAQTSRLQNKTNAWTADQEQLYQTTLFKLARIFDKKPKGFQPLYNPLEAVYYYQTIINRSADIFLSEESTVALKKWSALYLNGVKEHIKPPSRTTDDQPEPLRPQSGGGCQHAFNPIIL